MGPNKCRLLKGPAKNISFSCKQTHHIFIKMSVLNKLWTAAASTASLMKSAVPSIPKILPSAGIFTSASLLGPRNILLRMHETGPLKKVRPPRKPLDGNPFMKGVILKTLIKKPKKPNSANRKCVLVRLSNGKEMVAYVPGIGHNLQVSFNNVFWIFKNFTL